MLRYVFKRTSRTPIPALGVLLFAATLCAVLCGLQKANDAELERYNETHRTIPVHVCVTNLSGTTMTNLGISSRFAEKFESEEYLGRYMTDLQKVCKHAIQGEPSDSKLVGVTSLALSPELWADNGAVIEWHSGWGEQVFAGSEAVCLIPHGMAVQTDEQTGEKYMDLYFEAMYRDELIAHTLRLQVVGTYRGGDGKSIYCPYTVCEQVYTALNEFLAVQAMQGTLKSNDDLESFKSEARKWFAEPNPLGEKTPCTGTDFIYDYYPFALSIQDELLQRAAATLQTSIAINRVCSIIVLVLSAAAGFLISFLTVRSRQKEIALMRTMGTPNQVIFAGFAVEQMTCVTLGAVAGGAYFLWQPASRLLLFVSVYFVGLTSALGIFLNNNLMLSIKEAE